MRDHRVDDLIQVGATDDLGCHDTAHEAILALRHRCKEAEHHVTGLQVRQGRPLRVRPGWLGDASALPWVPENRIQREDGVFHDELALISIHGTVVAWHPGDGRRPGQWTPGIITATHPQNRVEVRHARLPRQHNESILGRDTASEK